MDRVTAIYKGIAGRLSAAYAANVAVPPLDDNDPAACAAMMRVLSDTVVGFVGECVASSVPLPCVYLAIVAPAGAGKTITVAALSDGFLPLLPSGAASFAASTGAGVAALRRAGVVTANTAAALSARRLGYGGAVAARLAASSPAISRRAVALQARITDEYGLEAPYANNLGRQIEHIARGGSRVPLIISTGDFLQPLARPKAELDGDSVWPWQSEEWVERPPATMAVTHNLRAGNNPALARMLARAR